MNIDAFKVQDQVRRIVPSKFYPEDDAAFKGATVIDSWTVEEKKQMIRLKLTRPIPQWDGFNGSKISDEVVVDSRIVERVL